MSSPVKRGFGTSPFKAGMQMSAGHSNHETSPFNSKFTVLKLTQSSANSSNKTPNKKSFMLSPESEGTSQSSNQLEERSAHKSSIVRNLFPKSKSSGAGLDSNHRGQTLLSENTLPSLSEQQAFLSNESFARKPMAGFDEEDMILPKNKQRNIPKMPYKVLDAPALQDDYYLNLVDWSSLNDLVVGLQSCVYIWSAHSQKVTKLHDMAQQDSVCSVNWARRG